MRWPPDQESVRHLRPHRCPQCSDGADFGICDIIWGPDVDTGRIFNGPRLSCGLSLAGQFFGSFKAILRQQPVDAHFDARELRAFITADERKRHAYVAR